MFKSTLFPLWTAQKWRRGYLVSLETPLNWIKETDNILQWSHFIYMIIINIKIGMLSSFIQEKIAPQRIVVCYQISKYKVNIHFSLSVKKAVRVCLQGWIMSEGVFNHCIGSLLFVCVPLLTACFSGWFLWGDLAIFFFLKLKQLMLNLLMTN